MVLRLGLAAIIFAGVPLFPSASPAGVVWRDGFSRTLDTSKWHAREGCPAERSAEGWLCYSPANVWVKGGYLHLRQTPALSEGFNQTQEANSSDKACPSESARPYCGAMVSTYKAGAGWPARDIRASWAPPVLIEARVRWSGADGFWQAFTTYSTDRLRPTEFDIAEMRGARELYQFCAIHRRPLHIHLGTHLPFNATTAFHRYWALYESDRVTFGVNSVTCGTTPVSDAGSIGIDFVAKSADPERFGWPGLGGPVFGSPEFQVDWVRVSQF